MEDVVVVKTLRLWDKKMNVCGKFEFPFEDILTITLPLSRMLQTENLDKVTAYNLIQSILKLLNKHRCDENVYKEIFKEMSNLCEELDIHLTVLWQASRQTLRANIKNNNPEEYFKISIYIPLLDNIIEDINDRFSKDILNVFDYNTIFPVNLIGKTSHDLKIIAESLIKSMGCFLEDTDYVTAVQKLKVEIELWQSEFNHFVRNKDFDRAIMALFILNAIMIYI
ncbi:unnamed protein product [Psylliodes chrysocephalus]|uniref:Uncharacterized protein n=1 Tax=Psylliodes chrysocephalus TaxID=3402493 RepID=A0A9P0CMB2_9CUCU|nr:unnamed protein product [Psylliodes chrysocephala]